ncbi:MAG TPA: hypothetical protein VLX67_07375 [Stellaceae bacterium]|nr:hypothetical protein [Stellaceae bacterium]
MSEAVPFFPPMSDEQNAELTVIWDQLYALYLAKANGARSEREIDAEIEKLIEKRNAIRPWGWNTGRNWKDDIPAEVLKR